MSELIQEEVNAEKVAKSTVNAATEVQPDLVELKKEQKKRNGWKRDFKMNKWLYVMAIPVVAFFAVFCYAPMFGLVMAFENWRPARGFFGSEWVGFKNFIDFFTSPNFWLIIRNTFIIGLLGLVITFPLTIIFALSLNEVKIMKLRKVFQTISYVPYFISTVIVCQLVREFCQTDGLITDILVSVFGVERQNLLGNPNYFWAINLFSDVWQNLGYGSIVFIAALTAVNPDLNEAAAIDGANRLQRVWHVTIPAIMPTIVTMLVMKCGMLMSVGFDKILLLYNPGIYSVADVISTHVQRYGIEMSRYGYAAAVGLFNSVIGTTFLLVSNWISRRKTGTSIV